MILSALWAAPAARATLPGANGRIAFVNRPPIVGSGDLFTLTPGSPDPPTQVTHTGTVFSFWGNWNPSPGLRSGLDLAVASNLGGDYDIYAIGSPGAPNRQIDLTPGASSNDFTPTFSPTGTELAWTRVFDQTVPPPPPAAILSAGFTAPATLPLPQSLTRPSSDVAPAFSPNGRRIAYFAGGRIFAMDASGRHKHRLTGNGAYPDFSPDGKRIVYLGGNHDVMVMNADGSHKVNLTNGAFFDPLGGIVVPVFSPDGKQIAFSAQSGPNSNDPNDIFLMNADGSHPVNLTASFAGEACCPRWEPVRTCAGKRVTISGSEAADRIEGTRKADVIDAEGGNDVVSGLGGADRICGGAGRDRLIGGAGKPDRCFGGPGSDTADASCERKRSAGLTPPGLPPPAPARGGGCDGARITIAGGPRADALVGTPGHDVISGGGGADSISGLGGDDSICGGGGADKIYGGKGKDRILAGPGADRIIPGRGADTTDAGPGADRIDVRDGSPDTTYAKRGRDVIRSKDGASDINDCGPGGHAVYSDPPGTPVSPQDVDVGCDHVPKAKLTVTPAQGPIPLQVQFDASQSQDRDGDGTLANWSLDFGDGTGTQAVGPPPSNVAHTFVMPGTYHVKFTLTDNTGLKSTATGTIKATGVEVRLSWTASSDDLDSHLWLPSSKPYSMFWMNQGSLSACPFAFLQNDSRKAADGPESTLIPTFYPGDYLYAAYWANGTTPLRQSGAKVRVLIDGTLARTFQVPASGTGSWWSVFRIQGSNRALTAINTIGAADPSPYPNTTSGCP